MPSMQMMMAAATGGLKIQIGDTQVFALAVDPQDAAAGYSLESDGDISRTVNGVTTDIGEWIVPKFEMDQFECLMSAVSGSLFSGVLDVWQGLSVTRSWSVVRQSAGTNTFVGSLQIRRTGTSEALDTATITLGASVEI